MQLYCIGATQEAQVALQSLPFGKVSKGQRLDTSDSDLSLNSGTCNLYVNTIQIPCTRFLCSNRSWLDTPRDTPRGTQRGVSHNLSNWIV